MCPPWLSLPSHAVADQFHFHPDTYLELIRAELPDYDRLQDEVVAASDGPAPRCALELGTGTGVTAQAMTRRFPEMTLVGVDESAAMLDRARRALSEADLRVARLEDPLPNGPFDLVFSALAVHHLDGPRKADLFRRVADVLAPAGRFVLGDVIVPDDPADVVAPIDGVYDKPSTVPEQLSWLEDAGFVARVAWLERDLAVLVGDRHD
jgi:tRNA (cmo5U34)-methyltransferase